MGIFQQQDFGNFAVLQSVGVSPQLLVGLARGVRGAAFVAQHHHMIAIPRDGVYGELSIFTAPIRSIKNRWTAGTP